MRAPLEWTEALTLVGEAIAFRAEPGSYRPGMHSRARTAQEA
jgi:hypothetical protein